MQWNDLTTYLNLLRLFDDPDAEIRAQAAKVLGGFHSLDIVDDNLIPALSDASPRVRFFAAMALASRKRPAATAALVKMIEANNDADPFLRHAGMMGLAGCATTVGLEQLSGHGSKAVRLAAVVALRKLKDPAVARFLQDTEGSISLEAARAIHDVPISQALPQLAAFLAKPFAGEPDDRDAVFRRTLNANFRLGGADRAAAIARFAATADSSVSDTLRIEALQMLGEWAKPSGRDRVLGMWRPIEPRDATVAADALRPVLNQLFAKSNGVRIAAASVAGKLGVIEAGPALVQIVGDPKRDAIAAR